MRSFVLREIPVCLCLLATLLVGCGGDDSDSSGSAGDSTAASDPAANGGGGGGGGGVDEPESSDPAGGGNGEAQMTMQLQAPDGGGSDPGMMSSDPAMMGSDPAMMGSGDPAMMSSSGAPSMMSENPGMIGGAGGGYGGGYSSGGAGGGQGPPARPQDVRQWTDEHILTAVGERDARVVDAINARAESSNGDPQFAQLMGDVLAQSSGGGMPGGLPGGSSPFSLESIFGGPSSGAGPRGGGTTRPSQVPNIPPGSTPPGGARLDPRLLRPSHNAEVLDSLDVMIGQALLSYAPQAVQGTRNSASNLQNSVSGSNPESAGSFSAQMQLPPGSQSGSGSNPGNMSSESMNPGNMSSESMGAGPGGMSSEMMESAAMGGGYPGSGQPGNGFGAGANQGTLQDRPLIEAIVRGLVRNNTPQAWQLIDGIVGGDVSTPLDPETNTEIVIREVFSSPAPNVAKAEAMLTAALDSALADPAQNGATLRLITAINHGPVDHLLSLGSTQAPPPPVNGFGSGQPGQPQMSMSGQVPSSSQMQMGMSSQPQMSGYPGAGAAGVGEGSFGGGGAGAPGGFGSEGLSSAGMQMSEGGLGGGPGGYESGAGFGGGAAGFGAQPPGPPPFAGIPVAESLMVPVAKVLWSPSTAQRVIALLEAASSHADSPELLGLASTIPRDDVRKAVFDLFTRSHAAGAAGLNQSGLFRDIARDPGMLAVLKALPRSRPKPAATNGVQPPATPEETWVNATQSTVISLRDRLASVADDPALAFDGVPPVRLHKDAVAERAIRVVIPGDPAQALGESAPADTKIYYSRIVVTPRSPREMQQVVDHYEGRTKSFKREDRRKGILWYDGVKTNTNGTLQTMDVVVRQDGGPSPGGGGGAGYESGGPGFSGGPGAGGQASVVRFIIEIVVVVARDPSKAGDASVTAASL